MYTFLKIATMSKTKFISIYASHYVRWYKNLFLWCYLTILVPKYLILISSANNLYAKFWKRNLVNKSLNKICTCFPSSLLTILSIIAEFLFAIDKANYPGNQICKREEGSLVNQYKYGNALICTWTVVLIIRVTIESYKGT